MLLQKLQHHDSINFTPYITKGLDYGEKLSRVKGTTWSRQSLFFFRFSERSASARERRSREPRETRAAAGEEKSVPLPSRAFSQARGHLRVSRVLLDGLRKKRGYS